MKKILLSLLLVFFIFTALAGLVSCQKDKTGHTHEYNQENTDVEYLAAAADCKNAAMYYYSCSCGEKGTETFTYGKLAKHNYLSDVCTVCGSTIVYSEGLEFTFNDDNTYSVTGIGTCTDMDIVIPKTYNGLPVTSIGDYAFADCKYLQSATISNSVTSIGNFAFSWCDNLAGIIIPNSVTYIGNSAFCSCNSFTSVTIPNSVTTIDNEAFANCKSLESVKIGDSVTYIGDLVFYGCQSLASVTIPDSVTNIGCLVFVWCDSLKSIVFEDTSCWYFTNNRDNWNNKTGGDSVTVKDDERNVVYFASLFSNYYWYKAQ